MFGNQHAQPMHVNAHTPTNVWRLPRHNAPLRAVKRQLGETFSPPRRNVKGGRIGRGVEMLRPPSGARAPQAAWRVTRLSPTPAHLCLLAGCTRTGWAATLGAYIIHQSRHTLGRSLCSGGVPVPGTQKQASALGMKQSEIFSKNSTKSKYESGWKCFFIIILSILTLRKREKGAMLQTQHTPNSYSTLLVLKLLCTCANRRPACRLRLFHSSREWGGFQVLNLCKKFLMVSRRPQVLALVEDNAPA